MRAAPVNYDARTTVARTGSTAAGTTDSVAPKFNGSSDCASVIGVDLAPYPKLTVSWWGWWDSLGTQIWMEYSANYNSNNGFIMYSDGSGTNAYMSRAGVPTLYAGLTVAEPSVSRWHHYSVGFDRTVAGVGALAFYHIDGAQPATLSSLNTYTTATTATLFLMSRNNGSIFGPGRMRNLTIHNRLLGYEERRELYRNSYQILRSPSRRVLGPHTTRRDGWYGAHFNTGGRQPVHYFPSTHDGAYGAYRSWDTDA